MDAHDPILAPWTAFYTITGSSAAALIGLMFVVITLVTDREEEQQTTHDGISIFSTPTVIHFGAALFVSAALCAPWPSLVGPAALLAIVGMTGTAFVIRAMVRTRNVRIYTPDTEDLVFYGIVPLVAYVVLLVAGILIAPLARVGSFGAAAAVLLLILVGIRNSWDVVTFIAIDKDTETPDGS